MKAAIALAGFALLVLPAGGLVSADHCNGTVTAAGALYLDDRGTAGGIWLYAETNNVEGLQSGGPSPYQSLSPPLPANGFLGYYDGCSHPNPDLMLF